MYRHYYWPNSSNNNPANRSVWNQVSGLPCSPMGAQVVADWTQKLQANGESPRFELARDSFEILGRNIPSSRRSSYLTMPQCGDDCDDVWGPRNTSRQFQEEIKKSRGLAWKHAYVDSNLENRGRLDMELNIGSTESMEAIITGLDSLHLDDASDRPNLLPNTMKNPAEEALKPILEVPAKYYVKRTIKLFSVPCDLQVVDSFPIISGRMEEPPLKSALAKTSAKGTERAAKSSKKVEFGTKEYFCGSTNFPSPTSSEEDLAGIELIEALPDSD